MRKKRKPEEHGFNVWRSYSDMMAGVLLLFVLIMCVTLFQAQKSYQIIHYIIFNLGETTSEITANITTDKIPYNTFHIYPKYTYKSVPTKMILHKVFHLLS